MKLLTSGNPKLAKGVARGWHTAVLHLSPARVAGMGNVCPWATDGCKAVCINVTGRAGIAREHDADGLPVNAIQAARKRRTQLFFSDRQEFVSRLYEDIAKHVRQCNRLGLRPAVRLNGTSDLPWERITPELFEGFSDVQFYDYTKSVRRMEAWAAGKLPANYHLTFSRSESNGADVQAVLAMGGSVAVVSAVDAFDLAEMFGAPVKDGDADDLRFLDPAGYVIALTPKGPAKRERTGFVVRY
jgi:hypothetical protein